MAISFVGAATGASGSGGNVTITLPAGMQENDVVFVWGGFNTNSGNVEGPLSSQNYEELIRTVHASGSNGSTAALHFKIMGSTPDTSVVCQGSGSSIFECVYIAYVLRGLDLDQLLDTTIGVHNPTSGNPNPAGVTPLTAGAWILAIYFGRGGNLVSAPSGYSNIVSRNQGGTWHQCSAGASKHIPSPVFEDPGQFQFDGLESAAFCWTVPLRAAGAALKPQAPELSITAGPDWVQAIIEEFVPNPSDPTDTHTKTDWQITLATDPTFASPVFNVSSTSELLDLFRDTLVHSTNYLIRARVYGEIARSDWSVVYPFTTAAGSTRGDIPELSLVAKGPDFIEIQITPYNHVDGEVEPSAFDPDNPKPFLVSSEFQINLQSDAGWTSPDDTIEVFYDESVDSLRVRFNGLIANTGYKFRGRQLDGFLEVYTLYSLDLLVTTDSEPVENPLKPTATITLCGRNITLEGDAYAHTSSGPGTNHAFTQVRICSGSRCTTTTLGPVTEYTWQEVPGPSTVNVYMRYGDDSSPTRWGLWSDADTCVVPIKPPYPRFINPTNMVQSVDVVIEWVITSTDSGWLFNVELAVDGGAFIRLSTEQAGQTWAFDVDAVADGYYLFRVQSVNPTTGEVGDWSYLPLIVDRDENTDTFHKDAEELALALGTQIWDGPSFVLWAGMYEGSEPLGIFASRAHNGGFSASTRKSGWVFPEWGEPDEFDLIAVVEHFPNECQWYPYRFANPQVTLGGAMAFGIDGVMGTRSGHAVMMQWFEAWYLHPLAVCTTQLIKDQSVGVTAWWASEHPANSYEYGRSMSTGDSDEYTARFGRSTYLFTGNNLPSSTARVGGPYFVTRIGGQLNRQPYTIEMRVRRTSQGGNPGRLVSVRWFGNGVGDPASGYWHHERFLRDTDDNGDTLPAGALGFAFQDMDEVGVGRTLGILFSSITVRIPGCNSRLYRKQEDGSWLKLTKLRALEGAEDIYTLIAEGVIPPAAVASGTVFYKMPDGSWEPLTC